jgi:nucleoside-diphosphate-sugar epimerase
MRNDKQTRVVVLGAAGFIGFHIVTYLLKNKNHDLLLVDNFTNSKLDTAFENLIRDSRINFRNLDLTLQSSYENLFSKNDIVFNCAALNGTQNFYSKPTDVIRNSAISAILAAEYSSICKVRKYVYFGSSESYAGGLELGLIELPTIENVPLVVPDVENVRWSYGASKTLGEIATIANHEQHNLNFLIVRLHNIYGPRMGTKHVIPDLIQRFLALDGGVYGLDETRSFMFVDDFIELLMALTFESGIKQNCVYNIGSQNEILIKDLAIKIRNILKLDLDIYTLGNFSGSVRRRCPDTSKLRSQVSFNETSLDFGIRETINWYLSNSSS